MACHWATISLTPCKSFAFAVSRSGKETLLRKASETTAHVAGFGLYSKDGGPSSILEFTVSLWSALTGAPYRSWMYTR